MTRSPPTRSPRSSTDEPAPPLAALDALFRASECGVRSGREPRVALMLADRRRRQLMLMLRLAALRETDIVQVVRCPSRLPQVLESRSPNSTALRPRAAWAGRAARALVGRDPRAAYRQGGDFQKPSACHECRSDDRDPARKWSCLHAGPPRRYEMPRAFERGLRHLRARPAGGSSRVIRRAGPGRLSRATAALCRPRQGFRGSSRLLKRRGRWRAPLYNDRAGLPVTTSTTSDRYPSFPSGSHHRPRQHRGVRRSGSLPRRERYADLSIVLQRARLRFSRRRAEEDSLL